MHIWKQVDTIKLCWNWKDIAFERSKIKKKQFNISNRRGTFLLTAKSYHLLKIAFFKVENRKYLNV